jgi:hypothetical protein
MVKILKLIDIFTRDLVLTYKGKDRFKTNFGGILTIILFITIVINGIFIGKDIFLKENPKVIQITKDEKFTPTFRLNKNNTIIKLGLSDDYDDLFFIDSILEIIPILYVQSTNDKNEKIYNEYFLELENCKKTKNDLKNSSKCIKDMDLYLTGSWIETSIAYLYINIRKCSNETYLLRNNIKTDEEKNFLENFIKSLNEYHHSEYLGNNEFNKGLNLFEKLKDIEKNRNKTKTICKPKEEIEKRLNEPIYMEIFYNSVDSNPIKHENSLFPNNKFKYFSIGNGLQKYSTFYYKNYVAQIDYGLIFEDYQINQNIIGVDYTENDFKIIDKSNNHLAELNFYMTAKTNIYKKNYIKVQEIFSQLGGFISLTILILQIFSWPFFMAKKNLKIMNEFYEFNLDDKKIPNNTSNINLEEINNKRIDDSRRIINKGNDIIEQNIIKEENKNQIDLEVIKILKDKKKKFTDAEIFRTSYYLICGNQNLKKKNLKYNLALENIYTGTDYLEVIKLNRDFKILKYLLFNNVQQRLFDFLINLKLGDHRLYDRNEYPEIIDAKDAFESLKMIKKYYEIESKEFGINRIDNKLLQILHPNIKKILEGIDI